MSHWRLDVEQLARSLNERRFERRITWRQLAAEAGISPATLTRITQGRSPNADVLVSLLTWLGWTIPYTTNGRDPEELP